METLQRYRAELIAGRIGRVLSFRCEIGQYLPSWRGDNDYRDGVSARRDLGGGALLELSHEIDLLRWVLGDVAWVSAWVGRQSDLEIGVEDTALVTLGFANGTVGQLAVDFVRRDTTRVCTAIGSDGTLRWDAVAGETSLFDPAEDAWRSLLIQSPDRDATYRAQLDTFLESVSRGSPGGVSANGSDGLAVLEIVEAIHRSASASGQRVLVGQDVMS